MKIMHIATVCLPSLLLLIFPQQTDAKLSISDADKNLILILHNYLRSQIPNVTHKAPDMKIMTWNDKAAEKAQLWADTCTRGHDKMPARIFDQWTWVGQNYVGTFEGIEFAVLFLYDEYDYWNWENRTCQVGQMCRHWTQIIWASTDQVGCGLANCRHVDGYALQLFCNYVDMGNYRGSNPYSVGRPCSSCPTSHPYCVDNLCSQTPTSELLTGKLKSNGKRECVFPFEYKGKLYHDCIPTRRRKSWCSEDVIYKKRWHYCKKSKRPCHFPFKYDGKWYESCLLARGGRYWCSETEIYSGSYHYCG